MPGRRLRPLLLAALAALLLAAGLAPASPSEPADETAEAGTIVTVLQPGWNMVGWIGPETATSELFEEIPTLQRVSAWDAEAQQYQRATRASSEELRTLTPGMGLWLRLGGNDAVRWTRPAVPDGLVLRLHRGLNFVSVVAAARSIASTPQRAAPGAGIPPGSSTSRTASAILRCARGTRSGSRRRRRSSGGSPARRSHRSSSSATFPPRPSRPSSPSTRTCDGSSQSTSGSRRAVASITSRPTWTRCAQSTPRLLIAIPDRPSAAGLAGRFTSFW